MHYSLAAMAAPTDNKTNLSASGSTLERMISERRDKADALRRSGRNPYRNDFAPTDFIAEVRKRYEGTLPEERQPGLHPVDDTPLRLAGRVIARRGMGKTVFVPIRDGSGDLQLFLNIEHLDAGEWQDVLPQLDVGDIVGAEGVIFWTKRGELSLLVKRFHIITKSLRPLPDKHHGLTDIEIRYRQRYLDLAVNPDIREVFRKRSRIISMTRAFLDGRDYLEVETPMMHSMVGGAAARPFVTHHNAQDMSLYLRIAPELYLKRLLVGGFERVYEINRNFRNEGMSPRHNPEFTMLEFYEAYATYENHMDLTEELVSMLAKEINGQTTTRWNDNEIELAKPWRRMTVREATTELGGISDTIWDDAEAAAMAAVSVGIDPLQVGRILLEGLDAAGAADCLAICFPGSGNDSSVPAFLSAFKDAAQRPALTTAVLERMSAGEQRIRAGYLGYLVFDQTAEHQLIQPTFITQFPLAVSPLARKNEADPAFCDRFELFIGGHEIANAFSELNDPDDQRARFAAQMRAKATGSDEAMDYDEDYCRALELGMPSAAGEGIGIDRLTMLLCGQSSIRDVILFPLMKREDSSAQ